MSGLGKLLAERIERSGDTSPGAFNLAADLVDIVSDEVGRESGRSVAGFLDGSSWPVSMFDDAALLLRQRARTELERKEKSCPTDS